MKTLIVYFSCSGNTKDVSLKLAKVTGFDVFEIEPSIIYSEEDLDWKNENSRSSMEMKNSQSRPEIKNRVKAIEQYDTIYIGYPIWWDVAPRIINTFIESYDLSNKKIITFCTSGSDAIDNSTLDLIKKYPKLNIVNGKRLFTNNDETISSLLNI